MKSVFFKYINHLLILIGLSFLSACTFSDFLKTSENANLQKKYDFDDNYFANEWGILEDTTAQLQKHNEQYALIRSNLSKICDLDKEQNVCSDKYVVNPNIKLKSKSSPFIQSFLQKIKQQAGLLSELSSSVASIDNNLRQEIKNIQILKKNTLTQNIIKQVNILQKALIDNIIGIDNLKQNIIASMKNIEPLSIIDKADKTNPVTKIFLSYIFISGAIDEIKLIKKVHPDLKKDPDLIIPLTSDLIQQQEIFKRLLESYKLEDNTALSLILIIALDEDNKKNEITKLKILDFASSIKATAIKEGFKSQSIEIRKIVSNRVKNNAILIYTVEK